MLSPACSLSLILQGSCSPMLITSQLAALEMILLSQVLVAEEEPQLG